MLLFHRLSDHLKSLWPALQVNESLKVAEETAKKIETAAAAYKPCAVRASALYFVLNELATIDPMYQFSLDAYTDLFHISIAKSPKSDQLQTRIKNLNDFHTYAVRDSPVLLLLRCALFRALVSAHVVQVYNLAELLHDHLCGLWDI